ncbi:MAG: hypothetical protein JST89_05130 [Cyanobacteria bacterium SZAS-4]|nr:hypothetical protein [Cyanobacteria bacterium SZAS-4]
MRTLRLIYNVLTALLLMIGVATFLSPLTLINKIWIASGLFGIVLTYIAVAEITIRAKTGTLTEFWRPYSTKLFWIKAIGVTVGSALLLFLSDQKIGWWMPCAFGIGIGIIAPMHGSLSGSFFSRLSNIK